MGAALRGFWWRQHNQNDRLWIAERGAPKVGFGARIQSQMKLVGKPPAVSPGPRLPAPSAGDPRAHPIQQKHALFATFARCECHVFMLRILLGTLRAAFGSVLRTSLCFGSQRLLIGLPLRGCENRKSLLLGILFSLRHLGILCSGVSTVRAAGVSVSQPHHHAARAWHTE
jgi:hypothetical protein